MYFKSIVLLALGALSSNSCEHETHVDLFDYEKPVDLSYILQAYDWQQKYEGDDGTLSYGQKLLQEFLKMSSICLKTHRLFFVFLSMPILNSLFSLMPRIFITVAPLHGISTAILRCGIGDIQQIF